MKALPKGGVSCSLQDVGKDNGIIWWASKGACHMHMNS
jgi:hypothetical protein